MNIFLSTWVLLIVGLLFALPMIFWRVKDHTESEDELPYVFDPFWIHSESNLVFCVVLSTHQFCRKNELNSMNHVSFHIFFGDVLWSCTRPRIILMLFYVTVRFDISWFTKTTTMARIIIPPPSCHTLLQAIFILLNICVAVWNSACLCKYNTMRTHCKLLLYIDK